MRFFFCMSLFIINVGEKLHRSVIAEWTIITIEKSGKICFCLKLFLWPLSSWQPDTTRKLFAVRRTRTCVDELVFQISSHQWVLNTQAQSGNLQQPPGKQPGKKHHRIFICSAEGVLEWDLASSLNLCKGVLIMFRIYPKGRGS